MLTLKLCLEKGQTLLETLQLLLFLLLLLTEDTLNCAGLPLVPWRALAVAVAFGQNKSSVHYGIIACHTYYSVVTQVSYIYKTHRTI